MVRLSGSATVVVRRRRTDQARRRQSHVGSLALGHARRPMEDSRHRTAEILDERRRRST
jgi:hypothetical protein